jgi:hypothetical protein
MSITVLGYAHCFLRNLLITQTYATGEMRDTKTERKQERWTPHQIGKERRSMITARLLRESDRGCAIFGAEIEILNPELEALLRAFCVDDPDSVLTMYHS